MKILVINSGSSSIKYRFFNIGSGLSLCKGLIERIGAKKSTLTHTKNGGRTIEITVEAKDHSRAIEHIFAVLTDKKYGLIRSPQEISGIGHRVVHGAEIFTEPTVINRKVIEAIEGLNELAPLHNPPAVLGIRACHNFAKDIPQVAVFDTAFHQTIPDYAYVYGIPYNFYSDMGIRRYGFHGTSHKFVAHEAARRLRRDIKKLKLITCHLGNGCSMTAVKNGSSIDTSMGFTPLEGLLMGTRCGDIDAACVLYIMEKKGYSLKEANDLLNKKSGLLGISGRSNDMRDIIKAIKRNDRRAKLALEIFLYRIKKYIGAYAAAMNGLDYVILTAGIGENTPLVKNRIAADLKPFLKSLKARVLVVPTNEELLIAQETAGAIS